MNEEVNKEEAEEGTAAKGNQKSAKKDAEETVTIIDNDGNEQEVPISELVDADFPEPLREEDFLDDTGLDDDDDD